MLPKSSRALALALTAVVIIAGLVGFFAERQLSDYRQRKIEILSKKRSVTEHKAPAPADTVFLFGDSRAARWPQTQLSGLGGVFNAGIGGDLTANMLWRLQQDIIEHDPEIVVLLAGINDITTASMMSADEREHTVARAITNLTRIIDQLNRADCKVIVFTITPPFKPDIMRQLVWGNHIESDVIQVNSALRQLKGQNVWVLDSVEIFKLAGGEWQEKVRADALHYSEQGYRLLRDALDQVIHSQAY